MGDLCILEQRSHRDANDVEKYVSIERMLLEGRASRIGATAWKGVVDGRLLASFSSILFSLSITFFRMSHMDVGTTVDMNAKTLLKASAS